MTEQALLLVNLGSPASPAEADVRRYLNQFLMDPYVIDLPWPLRRLLVSLILRRRPAASARAYASIWWPEGSPLVVLGQRLRAAMADGWPSGPVALAMRYGEPSIEQALAELARQGVSRVLLAPLYPQFADSTFTTVLQEARRVISRNRLGLALDVLPPFYGRPEYLDALASSVQPYLQQEDSHLLISYHGLPERHLLKADPSGQHCLAAADCCTRARGEVLQYCYRAQCCRTSQSLAGRLGLEDSQWSMAFQSRLGRARWIGPDMETHLAGLAHQGQRRVVVVCPSFVADCLETLEEVGERARQHFLDAGGESLVLVPCLNAQPVWVRALLQLCHQVR